MIVNHSKFVFCKITLKVFFLCKVRDINNNLYSWAALLQVRGKNDKLKGFITVEFIS